jgi:hypothetical protein
VATAYAYEYIVMHAQFAEVMFDHFYERIVKARQRQSKRAREGGGESLRKLMR